MTNTLESMDPQYSLLLPKLSEESEQVHQIEEKKLLVITGNPPYSGHSMNDTSEMIKAIDAYQKIDGEPLKERNLKWLQDSYVNFVRFAQERMEQVDEGIVAVITNHSWLNGPIFRGMRRSLIQSLEQIYVLDLHGSARRKEKHMKAAPIKTSLISGKAWLFPSLSKETG